MVIAPQLQKRSAYDPLRDFAPVSIVVMAPFVLVTHPSRGRAKTPANSSPLRRRSPGRYNFGSAGTGSTAHLGAEQLKMLAGIDIQHVPYKGAVPAAADLAAGQIQVLFNSMATCAAARERRPNQSAGYCREPRSPLIPDTPTLAETLSRLRVVTWYGIARRQKRRAHWC